MKRLRVKHSLRQPVSGMVHRYRVYLGKGKATSLLTLFLVLVVIWFLIHLPKLTSLAEYNSANNQSNQSGSRLPPTNPGEQPNNNRQGSRENEPNPSNPAEDNSANNQSNQSGSRLPPTNPGERPSNNRQGSRENEPNPPNPGEDNRANSQSNQSDSRLPPTNPGEQPNNNRQGSRENEPNPSSDPDPQLPMPQGGNRVIGGAHSGDLPNSNDQASQKIPAQEGPQSEPPKPRENNGSAVSIPTPPGWLFNVGAQLDSQGGHHRAVELMSTVEPEEFPNRNFLLAQTLAHTGELQKAQALALENVNLVNLIWRSYFQVTQVTDVAEWMVLSGKVEQGERLLKEVESFWCTSIDEATYQDPLFFQGRLRDLQRESNTSGPVDGFAIMQQVCIFLRTSREAIFAHFYLLMADHERADRLAKNAIRTLTEATSLKNNQARQEPKPLMASSLWLVVAQWILGNFQELDMVTRERAWTCATNPACTNASSQAETAWLRAVAAEGLSKGQISCSWWVILKNSLNSEHIGAVWSKKLQQNFADRYRACDSVN